jgi:hypothetical protein
MVARKSRSKFSPVRHPFLYELRFPANGKHVTKKAMAKVRYSHKPVTIELTAAHVRKSMKLKGVGNTSACSMAICAAQHADQFPHKVEGHIDWNYCRAFIVSKVDKAGLPSECYAYEHDDEIAKLNDTAGGQRKLLALIERDGPITIKLKPYRKRSTKGRTGKGRGTTDARKKIIGKGAKLRYAVAQFGAYPNQLTVGL